MFHYFWKVKKCKKKYNEKNSYLESNSKSFGRLKWACVPVLNQKLRQLNFNLEKFCKRLKIKVNFISIFFFFLDNVVISLSNNVLFG